MFQLAGLNYSGKGTYESITVKALQRTMDGFFRPDDPAEPLAVVEVQFQRDPSIYNRVAIEMAMVQQDCDFQNVEGIIFFADKSLDPKTAPWTGLIRSVSLEEAIQDLESRTPDHPLFAVFRPVFEPSPEQLEKQAAKHYRVINQSNLTERQRTSLADVFVSWLLERLGDKTRKELNMILNLPDVRDTVCGKELIEEGREEERAEVIARMHSKGQAAEAIAELTGYPLAEVTAILQKQGQSS